MTRRWSALRRRRKSSLATRLRIFWVFIVTIAVATAYAGYVIVTLPQLRLHAVDVRIAGLTLRETEVRRAAAIDRHQNVWLLNTARIARRIEAIPYVDRADVHRRFPADVVINVSEREPAACLSRGPRTVTVDRAQRILQLGCARASAIHIVLREGGLGAPGTYATGPTVASLLADGRALGEAQVGVHSIGEDRFGQLVAVGANGVEYLFGSDANLAEKVKLVGPVLAATRSGHAIRAIDLRAPATPTVQFR